METFPGSIEHFTTENWQTDRKISLREAPRQQDWEMEDLYYADTNAERTVCCPETVLVSRVALCATPNAIMVFTARIMQLFSLIQSLYRNQEHASSQSSCATKASVPEVRNKYICHQYSDPTKYTCLCNISAKYNIVMAKILLMTRVL